MPIDKAWLDLTIEETLEPALPICDPHHHLWDYEASRYLLDDLLDDVVSGHNVVCTVFVECEAMYRADGPQALKPVGETEFVNGVAAMSASGGYGATRVAAGIVGFADLTAGAAVEGALVAHLGASPRFRGIRHSAARDEHPDIRDSNTQPPKGLLLRDDFREGFARLEAHKLSFDAWLFHAQIPELTDLARAFPDTTIILDHFGGPLGIGPYAGKRDEIFEGWKIDIADLASCPNVFAKLGGLVMRLNGFRFHKRAAPPTSEELAAATEAYYLHAIEHFGVERCMFESNFPVDKASCSYNVLWNSFKQIASGLSESEKAALFHDTATKVYRL